MATSTLERARIEVIHKFEFWRQRLLSPKALAKLANDLGLGSFSASDITGLWKIGLLRADLVFNDVPMVEQGLAQVDGLSENSEYVYCDFRTIQHRETGLGSVLQDHVQGHLEESLAFHPFRVYVLHHIGRTLKISTSNMQFLNYEPGIFNVVKSLQMSCTSWTSSDGFGERFHYWNRVVETAAVVEPITFNIVFRDENPPDARAPLAEGFEFTVHNLLNETGKVQLREMVSDLGFAAWTLDENRSVHVLLRLMKWRERENLKGRLGSAMHFLAMAESIRRVAERTFDEPWPEEDEIGPGQWFPGARMMLYGAERVFDTPRSNLRDYLTQLGLDFGVKARCYVEGDTEFGALSHAVGNFDHVQLVNLNGSVTEKGGKGLAFARSLEADKDAGIFSVVVLDGDLDEYLRILRKAAEEERFHGRFFINQPDIECGNFSASELVETAIMVCQRNCLISSDFSTAKLAMLEQASSVRNNGDLIALLKKSGLTNFRKNESWGKALMELAIQCPVFPQGDMREGQERPLVEVAKLLIRMREIGFSRSVAVERIDSINGKMNPYNGAT